MYEKKQTKQMIKLTLQEPQKMEQLEREQGEASLKMNQIKIPEIKDVVVETEINQQVEKTQES